MRANALGRAARAARSFLALVAATAALRYRNRAGRGSAKLCR
jgi:hypothetical protein